MTPQEIFDIAVGAIIRQGALSKDENGTCLYRGPKGTMCAVGVLLEDDVAEKCDALQWGSGGNVVGVMEAGLLPNHLHEHLELLVELQSIHDGAFDVAQFKTSAKRLARKRHIKWRFK